MTIAWNVPAQVLTSCARDWDGVWMLVYAAGTAAMNLASVPGADDDLGLTYASLDISYALTELEQQLVDFTNTGVTVDLGPVDRTDLAAAVAVIDDLLAAAGALASHLSGEPGVGGAHVLCAARVAILVASARAKATGGHW